MRTLPPEPSVQRPWRALIYDADGHPVRVVGLRSATAEERSANPRREFEARFEQEVSIPAGGFLELQQANEGDDSCCW